MSYLLDTNICSAHLKRPGGLAHRMLQYLSRKTTPAPLGLPPSAEPGRDLPQQAHDHHQQHR